MKINIYGVGRSGTKAVHLYFAYLLAKKEQKVTLHYEPYLYTSRYLKIHNHKAVQFHLNEPQLAFDLIDFSKEHRFFLKNLSSIEPQSIVTKFIRGTGRLQAISKIMKPDFEVLVVRDLFEVLRSVNLKGFNFYSVGSKIEFSFWKKMVKELKNKKWIFPNDLLDNVKSPIVKNAIYWYVTNKTALFEKRDNLYVVSYEELSMLEQIAKKNELLGVNENLSIKDKDLFYGNFIHKDYPLQNISSIASRRVHLFNKLLFTLTKGHLPGNLYMPVSSGDEVIISTALNKDANNHKKRKDDTLVIPEKYKALLNLMNEDIKKDLDTRKFKYEGSQEHDN